MIDLNELERSFDEFCESDNGGVMKLVYMRDLKSRGQ